MVIVEIDEMREQKEHMATGAHKNIGS